MLDYNTKRLVFWVLKEFRAPMLLASLSAVAAGYAFGCFSKAHVPNNSLVSVFELNAAPARYNARGICVRGTLLNLKDSGAEPEELPYALFSLKETRAAGDYDFVNIISFDEREAPGAGLVTACGVFSAMKQVGKDTYHNVIFLNGFKAERSGKIEGPVYGPRKSRAF
ncbi:MAG: hypothetical protein A2X35_03405 [Elusimicrobia bacterium GWA2_61_42]|nr:MAG: hypothetical protein A2X35_03405 [Elusimicrobia bacterium GWA2_61_42]OGR77632.1 MAG: hypothetical protein A2X38_09645 [Elusimicrobia bacterium GWC2_61_25]